MKVLKPEIDKINDKLKGKDPMKAQQETMGALSKSRCEPNGRLLANVIPISLYSLQCSVSSQPQLN